MCRGACPSSRCVHKQVSFNKEVGVRVNELVFWLTVWLNFENVLLTFKWYVFMWQKCSMLTKYAKGHFFNKWVCFNALKLCYDVSVNKTDSILPPPPPPPPPTPIPPINTAATPYPHPTVKADVLVNYSVSYRIVNMLVPYNSREWFWVEKPDHFSIGVMPKSNENTFAFNYRRSRCDSMWGFKQVLYILYT